jgi:hypothetical protein
VGKLRKLRSAIARAKHEESPTPPAEQSAQGKDPLEDVHVHSPRWRPPISSTPGEQEQAQEDEEISDDDDTLEFERPRPLI